MPSNLKFSLDGNLRTNVSIEVLNNIRNIYTGKELAEAIICLLIDCLCELKELFPSDNYSSGAQVTGIKHHIGKSIVDLFEDAISNILIELIGDNCFLAVKALISVFPYVVKVPDFGGRLPLHRAMDSSNISSEMIDYIITANHSAVCAPDNGGRLPLHFAVSRSAISAEIIRKIVDEYPEGLSHADARGRLPLHSLLMRESPPPLAIVKHFLDTAPLTARAKDRKGCLPLHTLLDRPHPDERIVDMLLGLFPEGARQPDIAGRLPLRLALAQPKPAPSLLQKLAESLPGETLAEVLSAHQPADPARPEHSEGASSEPPSAAPETPLDSTRLVQGTSMQHQLHHIDPITTRYASGSTGGFSRSLLGSLPDRNEETGSLKLSTVATLTLQHPTAPTVRLQTALDSSKPPRTIKVTDSVTGDAETTVGSSGGRDRAAAGRHGDQARAPDRPRDRPVSAGSSRVARRLYSTPNRRSTSATLRRGDGDSSMKRRTSASVANSSLGETDDAAEVDIDVEVSQVQEWNVAAWRIPIQRNNGKKRKNPKLSGTAVRVVLPTDGSDIDAAPTVDSDWERIRPFVLAAPVPVMELLDMGVGAPGDEEATVSARRRRGSGAAVDGARPHSQLARARRLSQGLNSTQRTDLSSLSVTAYRERAYVGHPLTNWKRSLRKESSGSYIQEGETVVDGPLSPSPRPAPPRHSPTPPSHSRPSVAQPRLGSQQDTPISLRVQRRQQWRGEGAVD